jgi:hypothetical protein
MRFQFFLAGMKAQLDEGGRRKLLGDNRRWGGHTAAHQVTVRWSLHFNSTPFYTCKVLYIYIVDTQSNQFRFWAKCDLRRPFQNVTIALSRSVCMHVRTEIQNRELRIPAVKHLSASGIGFENY